MRWKSQHRRGQVLKKSDTLQENSYKRQDQTINEINIDQATPSITPNTSQIIELKKQEDASAQQVDEWILNPSKDQEEIMEDLDDYEKQPKKNQIVPLEVAKSSNYQTDQINGEIIKNNWIGEDKNTKSTAKLRKRTTIDFNTPLAAEISGYDSANLNKPKQFVVKPQSLGEQDQNQEDRKELSRQTTEKKEKKSITTMLKIIELNSDEERNEEYDLNLNSKRQPVSDVNPYTDKDRIDDEVQEEEEKTNEEVKIIRHQILKLIKKSNSISDSEDSSSSMSFEDIEEAKRQNDYKMIENLHKRDIKIEQLKLKNKDVEEDQNNKKDNANFINSEYLLGKIKKADALDGIVKDLHAYDNELETKSIDMHVLTSIDPNDEEIEDVKLIQKICQVRLFFKNQ